MVPPTTRPWLCLFAVLVVSTLATCVRPNPAWENERPPHQDGAVEVRNDAGAHGRSDSRPGAPPDGGAADSSILDVAAPDLTWDAPYTADPDSSSAVRDAPSGADRTGDATGLTCATGCACERTCGAGSAACTCAAGCACQKLSCATGNCAVTCNADSTCQLAASDFADGTFTCAERAVCEFRASEASNVVLSCAAGSRCTLECRDVSNCDLDCRGGTCLLSCVNVENCRRHGCAGGAFRSCGGGVWVCSRACPCPPAAQKTRLVLHLRATP